MSHVAKDLPPHPGTRVKTSFIKQRKDSWQIHLQQVMLHHRYHSVVDLEHRKDICWKCCTYLLYFRKYHRFLAGMSQVVHFSVA